MISPQFLDELRARTTLSALIGRTVALKKAGGEHKGCCPFHSEKTASFTVADDKQFYHCFGCGAHGDAIRWMTDGLGLAFMDAVKELAGAAGLELPARSADQVAREEKAASLSEILEAAARWYAEALAGDAKALADLAARGVDQASIARFGIGYAPRQRTVSAIGVPPARLVEAGLMFEDAGSGLYRDRFRQRFMLPVHDARGRCVGFAGRAHGDPGSGPKYTNSPESAAFDKGDILFNLHRAAPAARLARRLILVEGQLDVVAMDAAGIGETVAPMGTALTERQLERAWRIADAPILLLDGDAAGRKAALRAAERALAGVGPGRTLAIAALGEGDDPDSVIRSAETIEAGRAAIEAVLTAARPLADWLWETLSAQAAATPEGKAALRKRLTQLAGTIRDEATKAQYLADWIGRFDARHPPAPPGLTDDDIIPDGRIADLTELGEAERTRLVRAADCWLRRLIRFSAATPEKAGRLAWDVGRRVAAGLIGEEVASAALTALAWSCAKAKPADLIKSFEIGRKVGFDAAPMLLDMKCAGYERTDMGNAERWRDRYGQDFLYTTAKGWLGWDGRRYRVLNQEKDATPAEVMASVFETVRAIQREGQFVRDTGWPENEAIPKTLLDEMEADPRRPAGMDRMVRIAGKADRLSAKLMAWGRTSEASGRLGCIPNLVKRWVTVELTEFDTDPMLLNCMNGTLRLIRPDSEGPARVELMPHRRDDRLTKLAACDYDENAPAALFQKLVKWAQPDRDRRRYLRQWLGYNLTGDMGEQIFHIWYGPLAANGKSTVGNACREAMGDYGDHGKVETFLETGKQQSGDAATPAIVRLPGIRMLTAGEPKAGLPINEPLINALTGGDAMLARDNFRSFFRFYPIFKFTLWCNELPPIPRGTAGIWRRVKVMPWEQHLEPHQRDRELPNKLKAEYAGILAWMVRGLLDWMENGFVEPESVQLASLDYKQDSDPISSFLRLCTEMDPEARVQSSHLYELFCAWAKAAGETEWKQKGFSQALKAKGLVSKASNGMHWLGLRMIRQPDDFVDHQGHVRPNIDLGDGPPAAAADPGASARGPPPDLPGDDFVPGFDDV